MTKGFKITKDIFWFTTSKRIKKQNCLNEIIIFRFNIQFLELQTFIKKNIYIQVYSIFFNWHNAVYDLVLNFRDIKILSTYKLKQKLESIDILSVNSSNIYIYYENIRLLFSCNVVK